MPETTVRERGILFSDRLVRAFLDGRKTQTRRVMRPQPPEGARSAGVISNSNEGPHSGGWLWLDDTDLMWAGVLGEPFRCPYGVPGDRLYVREAWSIRPGVPTMGWDSHLAMHHRRYRADGVEPFVRWRPSIHMPKWAARIWLEITDVRVERVQEISENDAWEEGVEITSDYIDALPGEHRRAFAALWDQTNAHRPGCTWADNPWVWCLTFRRVEP